MWRYHKLLRSVRVWRLKRRDGGKRCHYCTVAFTGTKNRQRTVDHRVPRSRGGTNRLSNLVFACGACNRKKGDMVEAEFLKLQWLDQRRYVIRWERAQAAKKVALHAVV